MSIKVWKSLNYYGFILSEQELRRIYKTLFEQMEQINGKQDFTTEFKVKYQNGLQVKKTSIDDILSESNGGVWSIQEIDIMLYSITSRHDLLIWIWFKKISKSSSPVSIHYEIKGIDRNWVYITNSLLVERITQIKRLSPNKIKGLDIVIPVTAIIIIIVISVLSFLPKSPMPLGEVLLIGFITLLLTSIFYTFFYFFPLYNFYWGDYIKILDRRQSIGKYIIFGVIVTIILSVIANYITALFMGH